MNELMWHHSDGPERLFDSCGDAVDDFTDALPIGQVPPTLRLLAYRRMETDLDHRDVLEWISQHLDETYGDPDGCDDWDPGERTTAAAKALCEAVKALCEAVKALCEAVKAEYTPWACVRDPEHDVTVRLWIEDDGVMWEAIEEEPNV